VQSDQNNAPALQNLGIVALRRDDIAGAASFLTRALALNPRLPLALNTLGVVHARQGDYAHAVESWNRAVDIDPRQYDALFNIGLGAMAGPPFDEADVEEGGPAIAPRPARRCRASSPPRRKSATVTTWQRRGRPWRRCSRLVR